MLDCLMIAVRCFAYKASTSTPYIFCINIQNLNGLIAWAQQNEDGRGEKQINDLLLRYTW